MFKNFTNNWFSLWLEEIKHKTPLPNKKITLNSASFFGHVLE